MPRPLLPVAVVLLAVLSARGQPQFEPAKAVAIDAETLRQIEAKRADLGRAIAALALPATLAADVRADVEVYAKAAEWVVRHGEFFAKDSPKQTLGVLDAGLRRAADAAAGRTPWRDVRGKPVVRGYRSEVDGSVQPFAVTLPEGYGTPGRTWRLDVVLHGRDQTLTEVKFIHAKEAAKGGSKADSVVLEPYGRGNNAYRWAGETDVFEAMGVVAATGPADSYRVDPRGFRVGGPVDPDRVVLRGFSMGGAGTWHVGLHHPFRFAVIGPGAGFTTTRGYIKNLPAKLPDYVERCLHIYDAADYAENAFDVPVVAYSGEKDGQKAAADTIEQRLKGFGEPVRFTHVVAPGLAHSQPAEWQAKLDTEYRKHLPRPAFPERVRFVTYTSRYSDAGWAKVKALDRHYDKAVVDGTWTDGRLELTTTNVRGLVLSARPEAGGPLLPRTVRVDGQPVTLPAGLTRMCTLRKTDGVWAVPEDGMWPRSEKQPGRSGPIDDAFTRAFAVVGPTAPGWHEATGRAAAGRLAAFARDWDKYFRGALPTATGHARGSGRHLVLFGDPASNPMVAEVVKGLPITWTRERLMVNGREYDSRTHLPVMISVNPLDKNGYVVLNSGHTFGEADLKGTNALLYPRLGDWAVLKVDGPAIEVADAGIFDEFWQFEKR